MNRIGLAVALLLGVSVTLAPARSSTAPTKVLPSQSAIGAFQLNIVDAARADPVQPQHRREWMVAIYYPARPSASLHRTSYAPDPRLAQLLTQSGYYDTPKADIERWAKTAGPASRNAPAVRMRLPL